MGENEVIKEGDLVQLDGTIDKLITNLNNLNSAYASTVEVVKNGAEKISSALKTASGATKEGKKAIDESAAAADRYERAQKELAFAMSEVGKQVAWLKAQTADANKATVAQQRQLEAVAGSYDKIGAEVKELTALYKSLSEAEKKDASFGGELITMIREKRAQLAEMNRELKPHIEQLSRLQKAEKELAYWQSEEGKKLLQVKKQIRELTTERKKEKTTLDAIAEARNRLSQAESGEMRALYALNNEISKAEKLAKLTVKENAAQAGSYERMSAQYARAKEELKQLNLTLPENAEKVNRLEQELREAYAAMRQFQESTGVYSLGVGDYKQAFTGLNMAVQQVVRELPSAAVSLNTFFLAISNNIPILTDEIKRARLAFDAQKEAILSSARSSEEAAVAIGKLEKPTKKVIKSLFSWQTALVVVLSILPKYGEAIIDWVGSLFQSENAVKRLSRALRKVREEMKDNNSEYGKNMVTLRKLTDEYKKLSTVAEKTQWIKDNEDKWRELNVAIYDVADAEKFFIENSDKVKEAFVKRARAAAAYALTEKLFKEQLQAEEKLMQIKEKGVGAYKDKTSTVGAMPGPGGSGDVPVGTTIVTAQQQYDDAIEVQEKIIERQHKQIELYYDIAAAATYAANAELGEYSKDKYGPGGRDVTRYIESTKVKVTKEAEEAITRMQISEFAKRKKEAIATYNEEVGQLKNVYAENKRILDGYYKLREPLDDAQRQDLEKSQADIEAALAAYEGVYKKTLSDISIDEKIAAEERANDLIQIRLAAAKEGSEQEYDLRKQAIEKQRELDILKNSKLIESERQDEAAINAKYNKQLEDLEAEKTYNALKIARQRIAIQLEAVKEGGKAEYGLRKADIEAQKAMEIAENSMLAEEEQQNESAIIAKYNKQLEDLEYEHQMAMNSIVLEGIELRLGAAIRGSQQELNLLLEQIEAERTAAIKANAQLAEDLRQSENDINAYYNKRSAYARGNYGLSSFRASQTTSRIGVVSGKVRGYGDDGSRKREVYNIEQSLLDISKQIELAEAGKLELNEEQLANLKLQKAELEKQKKELTGFKGIVQDIADGGITGGILGAMGFNDEAISAFSAAVDTVIDNINAVMEAEIEAAEAAVEAAEKRVSAAENAYEAEIEARNNGYANSVETARKELEQERRNQQDKQKLLEEAQRRQESLNTITQTSSLITASAQLWSAMSSIPIAGPALAAAAIAAMFGSFAYAKVKAKQVTAASSNYGEGGLEFLSGGSHASGNDISLGTKNSKGRNMRAEGGEALAIINKRNTKRYRKELPGIIESLNKGMFEDKYFNVFANSGERSISINHGTNVDLSTLEKDVRGIRKSSETKYHATTDGTVIVHYKNLRRTVKS